jgi:3-hydroxyisobutyrate dehydrogenase
VIGLGAMGSEIAKNMRSVTDVSVYDPVEDRMRSVAEAIDADWLGSAEDAARGAGAVVVVVVNAAQAEAALFGPEGAISGMAAGSVVIVMSTIGPTAMRDLADRVSRAGHATIDAPMTGGSVLASRGELLVFAAGSSTAFERVEPLLQSCSRDVRYVGPEPGSGQTVKLVNQLLCTAHMIAAAEALAFTRALGLDQHAVLEMLKSGAGASFILNNYGERMIDGPYQPPTSAMTILLKDAGLVLTEAESRGLETPVLDAAHRMLRRGADAGLGEDDITGIIRVYGEQMEESP